MKIYSNSNDSGQKIYISLHSLNVAFVCETLILKAPANEWQINVVELYRVLFIFFLQSSDWRIWP